MSTALAPVNQLPTRTHLGDRDQIAAIHSRLASMMQLPADVPADVIWAAAQIAAAHHLDPFVGELYIMPTGAKKNETTGQWEQQYRAHVGVKGLRKIAREQANFTAKLTVMDEDEVQRYRRDMYHPDDIGVRCTLWRLDVARECKDAGIPYEPVVGVGFWRTKAQWSGSKKEWMADNIPNTWTAQQVAEKRAEINAIKLAYDLVLDVADPGVIDEEALEYIQYKIHDEEERTFLPAPREYQVEDDGDILFAKETPRANGKKQAVDAPEAVFEDDVPADAQTPHTTPSVQPSDANASPLRDGIDGEVLFARGVPWYTAARDATTNGVRKLCDTCLELHHTGGPASIGPSSQYGYLIGLLDSVIMQVTKAKDGHKRVLPVLCQAEISKANPPSATLADKLLDRLATHIKDDDGNKIENPEYSQPVADAMIVIYHAAEAVGTPSLLSA